VTDIERSQAELRAVLMLAEKRIRKLTRDLNLARQKGYGKGGVVKDDPLLGVIRKALRGSREAVKRA